MTFSVFLSLILSPFNNNNISGKSPKILLLQLLYRSPDWPMDVNVQVMFSFLICTQKFTKLNLFTMHVCTI